MIPSFILRETSQSGRSRTHDARLAASQDAEIYIISLGSDRSELSLRRSSGSPQDSSSLGLIYVYPGLVKFKALQEVLVIPSYLSRSHIETYSELFNRLLKIAPSNDQGTVIQPGDQIVFPSGPRLTLELSDSVQVRSSLPEGAEDSTALPATFPSSPPWNPAIEETPRGRYQRSKNMSATQENTLQSFDPTNMTTAESQLSLQQGSQSPLYHTAREVDQNTVPRSASRGPSQSASFVDFDAPDSKTSAATSHLEVAGKARIDGSASLGKGPPVDPNRDNVTSGAQADVPSIESDQQELLVKDPKIHSPEVNEPPQEDGEDRGASPLPDSHVNLGDGEPSGEGSTTEKESDNQIQSVSGSPEGHVTAAADNNTVEEEQLGSPLPGRGRSKRKVEENPVETRATSKRTRLAGQRSKTAIDESEDDDGDDVIVYSRPRSSPHEHPSAPKSSSSSSRASLSDARGIRVIFSNATIFTQRGVKSGMKGLNIKEVKIERPNAGNYDILVVGSEKGEVKRTLKLLTSLVLGKPVVTEAWLEKCLSTRCIVDDYSEFTPPEAEESLNRTKIFRGQFIYISTALRKMYQAMDEITYICKKAGAKQVLSGAAKGVKEANLDNTIRLVAGEKDPDTVALNKMGHTCYSKDLLSTSILRGYIDWQSDEHEEYPPSTSNPAKKAKKGAR